MDPAAYQAILVDFREAHATAHGLIQFLVGKPTGSRQLYYVEAGFKTMVLFSASLLQAVPGGQGGQGPDAWNMPSACASARGIIEAYRALAYVAFHELSEEERAFRISVMALHDLDRRMNVLRRLGPYGTGLASVEPVAEEQRTAVQRSPFYASLSKQVKNKIASKDTPDFVIEAEELDRASGVDNGLRMIAQVFLSQFVHTHPMSMHSMYHFTPESAEARRLISLPMQYTLGYLVRATAQVASMFNVNVNYTDKVLQQRHLTAVRIIEQGLSAAEASTSLGEGVLREYEHPGGSDGAVPGRRS